MVLDLPNELSKSGFIRLPEILRLVPVSKSTWWAGIKTGRYPSGVKLSPNVTAWRVSEIEALLIDLSDASEVDL